MEEGAFPGRSEVKEGGPGELAGQCEGFISRRPSWEAAPDRELGKGQQPRVRGGPVHTEEAPMRVLARSMRAARSIRAQQALGARPWLPR